jgi:hypothetical protein
MQAPTELGMYGSLSLSLTLSLSLSLSVCVCVCVCVFLCVRAYHMHQAA